MSIFYKVITESLEGLQTHHEFSQEEMGECAMGKMVQVKPATNEPYIIVDHGWVINGEFFSNAQKTG